MRAYIDDGPWDRLIDDGTGVVVEDAREPVSIEYVFPMEPKKWYIEYDEEEEYVEKVSVAVDVSGLTNEQVIDLLTALNEAGFEADIRRSNIAAPEYPVLKPTWPVPPYTTYPYVTYNASNAAHKYPKRFPEHLHEEVPGQMGIHDFLDDSDD